MNNIKKILYIIILTSVFFALNDAAFANSTKLKKTRITWARVKGASAYQVVIKDENGKTLLNKKTLTNSIQLKLPYGAYKLKIGAYNKFFKIAAWSGWGAININHSYGAGFSGVSWYVKYRKAIEKQEILKRKQLALKEKNKEAKEKQIAKEKLKERNALKKQVALLLAKKNLNILYLEKYAKLTKEFANGETDKISKVEIMKLYDQINKKITEIKLKRLVQKKKNNGKKNLAQKKKQVEKKQVEKKKTIARNKKSKPYKGDGIFNIGLKVSLGWSFNMLFKPWDSAYNYSPYSSRVLIGYGLGNINTVKKIPFVNLFGFEFTYDFINFRSKPQLVGFKSNLNIFSFGLNFTITTNFNFPLNLIVRGGGGITYSLLQFTTSGLVSFPDGTHKKNSLDLFWQAGAALEIRFWHVHFELGATFYDIIHKDQPLYGIRYFITAGVRF